MSLHGAPRRCFRYRHDGMHLVLAKNTGFGQARAGRRFHGRSGHEGADANGVRYGQGTRLIRGATTAG